MTPQPKSLFSGLSKATLSIIALSALALCSAPASASDGAGIEGRWETAKKDLVLDISRCGERYCGRLVKPDNQCDRTVLTVVLTRESPEAQNLVFDGELDLPGQRRAYKARVMIVRSAGAAPSMTIVGDDVDPSFVRRTFPFRALLAQVGNASCRAGATS